ncbi:MAG: hypothetical protein GY860_17100, partial [Desulfobacteraceae bacterium]|nr:hypothetical protein [Desulfobacteraceae bacterium]
CPLFKEGVCAQVIQIPNSEYECLSLHDISKEYQLLTDEVGKISKPPAPVRNLKTIGNKNSLLMLIQRINNIEKNSQTELVRLLKYALAQIPSMSGGFWLFVEAHLDNAKVSQKEFEAGLDMVAAAMNGIAGHYDARTGIEFQFTGHPMVCVLMASVCFQIARKIGGQANIEIAGALFLEALTPLLPMTDQLWNLGIDIGYVAEKLEHRLKKSDAPSKLKELMAKWRFNR